MAGVNLKEARKGAGSVIEGIKVMQGYQLVITPDSHNLKTELNNYVWHSKKSDIPIDAYNHLIDSARYIVSDLVGKGRSIYVRK
jgi:phage terminase large subunit